MAERRPLVILPDGISELPSGDTLPPSAIPTFSVSIPFGDGSAVLTVGTKKCFYMPFACDITQWTLGSVNGTSGSVQVDIWVDSHANFPPTVADTITASAKPLFSSTTKGQSSTLTGWTTAIPAGRWVYLNIDSVTSITYLSVNLTLKRT